MNAGVAVRVGTLGLPGEWVCPPQARGVVVFAHGSGSGRGSPRNLYVAGVLHQHALATLLFDLLTDEECARRQAVFDVELLARRLVDAMDWLRERDGHEPGDALGAGPVGLFGASTGAAAALRAATERADRVCAVVCRGGRPDLAASHLGRVRVPTLLVVGGADRVVLGLNRDALRVLRCEKRLEVVPGATHLFEEPGALETVAHLAADWFGRHCLHRARWAS